MNGTAGVWGEDLPVASSHLLVPVVACRVSLPKARPPAALADWGMEMFNIEWLETLLSTLALISAVFSAYLLHRAGAVPYLFDHPPLTLAQRSELYTRAGSAAVVTVFFLTLLLASELIETMSGATPPTIAWPPQSN